MTFTSLSLIVSVSCIGILVFKATVPDMFGPSVFGVSGVLFFGYFSFYLRLEQVQNQQRCCICSNPTDYFLMDPWFINIVALLRCWVRQFVTRFFISSKARAFMDSRDCARDARARDCGRTGSSPDKFKFYSPLETFWSVMVILCCLWKDVVTSGISAVRHRIIGAGLQVPFLGLLTGWPVSSLRFLVCLEFVSDYVFKKINK